MTRGSSDASTLRLAGLLEGRVPPTPDFPDRLVRFEREAREAGFALALEIDGGRFGFLGDDELRSWPALGPEPEQALLERIEDLLRAFPDPASVHSTLRTTTTHGSSRTRTLYAIRPDGRVEKAQERDVLDGPEIPLDARGSLPPALRTWGPLTLVVLGLVGAYAADWFGLRSAFFQPSPLASVDFGSIDLRDFESMIEQSGLVLDQRSRPAALVLSRGKAFPQLGREELLARSNSDQTLGDRLILEALLRGDAQLVGIDEAGRPIGAVPIRVEGLFEAETIEVPLPLSGAQAEALRWAVALRLRP